MLSRACRSAVLLMSIIAAACGPGVITADGTPPPPLFSVRATATGTLTSTTPLRAALAWSVWSPELLSCLDGIDVDGVLTFSNETLEADEQTAAALQRCVLFSEQGRVETASVALEASFPLTLEIPVVTVPATSLLSGDEGARLGIADVLIYEDADGDDVFDETPRGASAFIDVVRGTSRAVDEEALQESFVVYREGDLSPVWKLYRAIYGCADPDPGFSTVTVGVSEDGNSYFCDIDDRAVPVTLRDDLATLGCAPRAASSEPVRADTVAGIPVDAVAVCESSEGGYDVVYSTNPDSVCVETTTLALVGCDTTSEARCRATFYDLRGDEPSWWPCTFGDGEVPQFFFTSAATLTAGVDVLFTVEHFSGLQTFPLREVSVQLDFPDGTTSGEFDIVIDDADDNGVLNAGDSITVSERTNRFDVDTIAGNWPARLLAGDTVIASGAWAPAVAFPTPPRLTFTATDAAAPITSGVDDLFIVTWTDGVAGSFALDDIRISGLVGGEFPIGGSGSDGVLVLVDDLDDDGRLGRGDSVLVRERPDGFDAVDASLLESFGDVVYVSVEVPIGFQLTGTAGFTDVTIR